MSKKVLILDGSLYSRMVLRDMLISHGYSVIEATTGEEAVEMYERLHPDLVTVDATTPCIDCARAVRQIMLTDPEASILMCGGRGQRRMVMEGMSYGAAGVLLKPFNERQVLREIRNAAGRPPTSEPMT
ncbi:MAG: response regulator [Armatimonadota bacterium]|nr:response regulator [Armatimonadota bacterium]